MPEYGVCQCDNCDSPAVFAVQFAGQPRQRLRCCTDCMEALAGLGDDVTRLTER